MKDFKGTEILIGDTIFFHHDGDETRKNEQYIGIVSKFEQNKILVYIKDIKKSSKCGKKYIKDHIRANSKSDPKLDHCAFVVTPNECVILN